MPEEKLLEVEYSATGSEGGRPLSLNEGTSVWLSPVTHVRMSRPWQLYVVGLSLESQVGQKSRIM